MGLGCNEDLGHDGIGGHDGDWGCGDEDHDCLKKLQDPGQRQLLDTESGCE